MSAKIGREPIGSKSNARSRLDGPRRLGVKPAWMLVVLVLCALPPRAWTQQPALRISMLAANSALPDAPQAQEPAAEPVADERMPGSILGVVADGEGAVCEGAHITLVQTSSTRPTVQTAASDGNGRFSFTGVAAGPFKLTISSNGFATKTVSGVLHSGESYDAQTIILPFSTATNEVRVTASTEEIAQEQVIDEEKQRVLGFIPNFYVVYAPSAAPLDKKQKFSLAWKTLIDPVTIAASAAFAGVEQADDSFSGYGQGAQGYAKRFGANLADNVTSTMIGGVLLPSLLKQDPRYFYKGTGTIRARAFYAIANAAICKGDNGRWQPNYSGIFGELAAGGISNLYYPASSESGISLTFENALLAMAEGAAQNLLQEFVIRRLTPKVPSYTPQP